MEKKRGSPDKAALRSRIRPAVSMTVAAAMWFSCNVAEAAQAAQEANSNVTSVATTSKFSVSAEGSEMAIPGEIEASFLSTGSGIATLAVTLIAVVFMGYNLAMTGKRGWGWATLCIAVGVVAVLVKVFASMFQEVASTNGIADWDSD